MSSDLSDPNQTPGLSKELSALRIDGSRLLTRIKELGEIGSIVGPNGEPGAARLALTDADKAGRDLVKGAMSDLGLTVVVDAIGNVFGTLAGSDANLAPVMCGSHIDTVATGGLYDGNLGVLAGIEVIETLISNGVVPKRPITVAYFTNEEGARFSPDMLGSLVYCGGLTTEEAYDIKGIDGASVGDELARIGYIGTQPCPGPAPHAFVELHIEQGPVLEAKGVDFGAVTGVQGISWQELTIEGQSNHAGTTPISMRHDPGYAGAFIAAYVRELAVELGEPQVGTVGHFTMTPNLVNVIPAKVVMTIDLRNTSKEILSLAKDRLAEFVYQVATTEGVKVTRRTLAEFDPVDFDERVVSLVEQTITSLGKSVMRLPSGAGHDAQMLARMCPTAMIFTQSRDGISHNPAEYTSAHDLETGANVLLQTLLALSQTAVL